MVRTSLLCMIVFSCSTNELLAASHDCSLTWTEILPPDYRDKVTNVQRSTENPTGKVVCSGYNDNSQYWQSSCKTLKKKEFYTVPIVKTVDRNKDLRETEIGLCTYQKCMEEFGNATCTS